MIKVGTLLTVYDNSGAKEVLCLKILGKKTTGEIGDCIVVSVKTLAKNLRHRVEKGAVIKAIIVSTRKRLQRLDGSSVRFPNNGVALLQSGSPDPLGTRIQGVIPFELRKKNQTKLLSLANQII